MRMRSKSGKKWPWLVPCLFLIFGAPASGAGEPQAAWKASSLGIPPAGAPWQLLTQAGDSYIRLRVPDDLALVDQYPGPVQRTIRTRIELRDQNRRILARLAADAERLLKREKLHRVPQYERSMNEIVLAIDQTDVVNGNPLFKHEPILRQLPAYTRIQFFIPTEVQAAAKARLRALGLSSRSTIHSVDVYEAERDGITLLFTPVPWTQDLFRVAVGETGAEYLFSTASYLQADDLGHPDVDYLQHLREKRKDRTVMRLPIFFKAGNILSGESDRPLLFVGKGELKFNAQLFFDAIQAKPSDEGVLSLLKATSGVQEAVVLPNSRNLFHLDMAVAFLEKGVAAVIDPIDKEHLASDDREVLLAVRQKLSSLGFRIVPIPTLTSRMKAYQSPVNAVFFVNRDDHKRYVFLPEYKDATVSIGGVRQSLNQLIRQRFRENGLTILPVADGFSSKMGDVHCVLKVIN